MSWPPRRHTFLGLGLLVLPIAAFALPGSPFAPANGPATAEAPPTVSPTSEPPAAAPVPPRAPPAGTTRTRDQQAADRAVAAITGPVDAILSDGSLPPDLLADMENLEGSKSIPEPREGGLGHSRRGALSGDGLGDAGGLPAGANRYFLSRAGESTGGDAALVRLDIDGPLPRAEVDLALRSRTNVVRYCYRRVLPNAPTLAGEATFTLDVAPSGTVSVTTLHRDIDPAVSSCIEGRLLRMALPARDAPTRVTATWRFSPG